MFKVLLNNFLHTTLSSSSQNELDFVIFHILLILHIFSKGIGLYDFAHFESQTEKCLHSGPAVCIGCVFEHSLFSKALWTLFQWCCIYVLQFSKSCVFQFAIQLFGNLAILVFLFCLGSDTSLPGLHKLCYPTIRDRSTWSKFGAYGEHGDVFLFSNLGAL